MILVPKYYWERVQEHRIILGIQYHDLRTSIEPYTAGECKKSVKKDQNPHFLDLFGGGLLELVNTVLVPKRHKKFQNFYEI